MLPVLLLGNLPCANAPASVYVIIQARSVTFRKTPCCTSFEHIDVVQKLNNVIYRPGIAVRTEIPASVLRYEPCLENPRKFLRHRHFDVWVCLVISQKNIILRCIFLNQIAFQNQSFHFGLAGDVFEFRNVRNHRLHLRAVIGRCLEILAHAVSQRYGLAHIDNLS